MSFLQDVLAMAVVLSIVVFIHEFGHFATAKLSKFPVEVFSFGFGKRLFGVKWRGTDYRVSALPLGGYVRVVGLGPDESTAVGAAEASPAIVGPRWKRAAILLAGPAMNFVLAIVLQAGIFMVGRKVPAYRLQPPVVESVAPGSPGKLAGFQKGDRIVSIDGKPVENWQDAEFAFAISPRQKLSVSVDRAGARQTIDLVPRGVSKFDIGYTGIGPALRPRIGRVLPGSPASAAGFLPGDVILSVAGEPVESVPEVLDAVGRHSPGPEIFVVSRRGNPVTLPVSPRKESDGWKIGVSLEADVPEVLEKFPPAEAVRQGWRSLRTDTQATLGVIVKLFAGRASVKQMSGPIAIGQFAGEAAREGVVPLIGLMGMLSLQLGILNLLPVPMLDGGQLAVLLIEGAIRRDFSLRVKERILQFGFVLLVLLMGVVIYNDILKVF
ncbi:MAG: RIP metalloprotease RseP [Thermoanaerobaculia bacterium]